MLQADFVRLEWQAVGMIFMSVKKNNIDEKFILLRAQQCLEMRSMSVSTELFVNLSVRILTILHQILV